MPDIEVLGVHQLALILIGLTVGLSLRHRKCQRKRCHSSDRTRHEFKSRNATAGTSPNARRFQIHDSARETQSVLQAQVAVLDRIADESDRDILRLEELLQEIRVVPTPRLAEFREDSEPGPDEPFLTSGESAEFVRVLHRSGFSAEEIAGSMHAPLNVIREILGESDNGNSKAA